MITVNWEKTSARFCTPAIILILVLGAGGYLFAQPQARFHRLAEAEGLSGQSVNCIFQDKQGYLWIGTDNGLNRYDGYQFTVYEYRANDIHSLSSNWVRAISEDQSGYLWVGTDKGLNRFDPKTQQFNRLPQLGKGEDTLQQDYIYCITESRQGGLWIGSRVGGLHHYDPNTQQFEQITIGAKKQPFQEVQCIYEGRQGALWIGVWQEGLYRLNPATGAFQHYTHQPNEPQSLGHNAIRAIVEDNKGRLWVGAYGGGLDQLDPETGFFQHYRRGPEGSNSLSHDNVWAIQEGASGRLWIGAYGGGVNLLDPETGRFYHYQHQPGLSTSLSNNAVRTIYQDREGLLWIGTNKGLNYCSAEEAHFLHFHYEPGNPSGLSDNAIWSLHQSEPGKLWAGTFNGMLNELNLATGQFRHFPYDAGHDSPIYAIQKSSDGGLWAGTFGDGLHRLDPQTGLSRHFRHDAQDPNSLSHDAVLCIFESRDSSLWIGTYYGLNRFTPATGRFQIFLHDPNDPNSLSDKVVWAITENQDGSLWIGTNAGLNWFDPATGRVKHYLHDPNDARSLSYDAVRSLFKDGKGQLWVGTRDGLNRFDETGFEIFHTEDGLAGDIIYGILEDEKGRLWISTNKGLSCFDQESRQFRNYNAYDGLQGSSFNLGAYCKDPSTGMLFFGGDNGFNGFHPDSIRQSNYRPVVVIESLARFRPGDMDHPQESQVQAGQPPIQLSYKDDILTFRFAALSFEKPMRNRYAYKLEGFNEHWIQLGTERSITFTDLAPGAYTLWVKGSNGDGVWNEAPASVRFDIAPPWWQTWWAKGFYGLLFAGLLWGIYRWRTKKHRQRIIWQEKELERERLVSERLRQVDQLKDQFLANTSHELRTPLQGIIGLSESLLERAANEREREDLSMVISSGKRLSNLVNDILDFSKLKNFDLVLNRKPVDVHTLVDVVLRHNAPLARGKKLLLANDVPLELPAVDADETKLQQILYNLIGNAIKFTEKGQVRVGARLHPQEGPFSKAAMVEVFVEDTGIGIPQNKREAIFQEFEQADGSISREFAGTGLGLSISKRLAELHGGQLWVESEVGKGSCFFFTLPASSEAAPKGSSQPQEQYSPPAAIEKGNFRGMEGKILEMGEELEKIQVLVVDDEPINQQVLKNHLSAGFYELTQAMNGEDAIRLMESGRHFDLVLLDVMMPRMSGYEVCQKIREKYLSSELPVIMVTARNQVEDLVEGLSAGANDYLSKPFSRDEFLARVKTQLDLYRIFDVTGRFIPNEFIRALGRSRITEVQLGDFAERVVTVFFSDIRSYTTLAESMAPEDNYRFVNAYNGRMGPIIQQNKGFVNQYLGDAIMSIFPENPADALKAAIGMQQALRHYNEARQLKGRALVRAGMGLHTGSLIMGIIGDRKRMDAATVSDTVNTASRIESLTKHYGVSILLSRDSLSRIDGQEAFHLRYLGQVLMKGKLDPIGIYECFDGDDPYLLDKKLATLDVFQEGLSQYLAADFFAARAAFSAVLATNPDDQPARLFLDKANRYLTSGAPEGWAGVELMDSK
ncbi:MAG: response regulator [Lewinellaceae bacterium]|nr:response regulator [Lewinellaceae bacterium]